MAKSGKKDTKKQEQDKQQTTTANGRRQAENKGYTGGAKQAQSSAGSTSSSGSKPQANGTVRQDFSLPAATQNIRTTKPQSILENAAASALSRKETERTGINMAPPTNGRGFASGTLSGTSAMTGKNTFSYTDSKGDKHTTTAGGLGAANPLEALQAAAFMNRSRRNQTASELRDTASGMDDNSAGRQKLADTAGFIRNLSQYDQTLPDEQRNTIVRMKNNWNAAQDYIGRLEQYKAQYAEYGLDTSELDREIAKAKAYQRQQHDMADLNRAYSGYTGGPTGDRYNKWNLSQKYTDVSSDNASWMPTERADAGNDTFDIDLYKQGLVDRDKWVDPTWQLKESMANEEAYAEQHRRMGNGDYARSLEREVAETAKKQANPSSWDERVNNLFASAGNRVGGSLLSFSSLAAQAAENTIANSRGRYADLKAAQNEAKRRLREAQNKGDEAGAAKWQAEIDRYEKLMYGVPIYDETGEAINQGWRDLPTKAYADAPGVSETGHNMLEKSREQLTLAKRGLGGYGQFAMETAGVGLENIPTMALYALNPVAGAAYMAATVLGEKGDEFSRDMFGNVEYSAQEALLKAAPYAAVETVTEAIGDSAILGFINKRGSLGLSGIAARSFLTEGAEEGAAGVLDYGLDYWYGNPKVRSYTAGKVLGDIAKEALQGGIIGGVMGAGGAFLADRIGSEQDEINPEWWKNVDTSPLASYSDRFRFNRMFPGTADNIEMMQFLQEEGGRKNAEALGSNYTDQSPVRYDPRTWGEDVNNLVNLYRTGYFSEEEWDSLVKDQGIMDILAETANRVRPSYEGAESPEEITQRKIEWADEILGELANIQQEYDGDRMITRSPARERNGNIVVGEDQEKAFGVIREATTGKRGGIRKSDGADNLIRAAGGIVAERKTDISDVEKRAEELKDNEGTETGANIVSMVPATEMPESIVVNEESDTAETAGVQETIEEVKQPVVEAKEESDNSGAVDTENTVKPVETNPVKEKKTPSVSEKPKSKKPKQEKPVDEHLRGKFDVSCRISMLDREPVFDKEEDGRDLHVENGKVTIDESEFGKRKTFDSHKDKGYYFLFDYIDENGNHIKNTGSIHRIRILGVQQPATLRFDPRNYRILPGKKGAIVVEATDEKGNAVTGTSPYVWTEDVGDEYEEESSENVKEEQKSEAKQEQKQSPRTALETAIREKYKGITDEQISEVMGYVSDEMLDGNAVDYIVDMLGPGIRSVMAAAKTKGNVVEFKRDTEEEHGQEEERKPLESEFLRYMDDDDPGIFPKDENESDKKIRTGEGLYESGSKKPPKLKNTEYTEAKVETEEQEPAPKTEKPGPFTEQSRYMSFAFLGSRFNGASANIRNEVYQLYQEALFTYDQMLKSGVVKWETVAKRLEDIAKRIEQVQKDEINDPRMQALRGFLRDRGLRITEEDLRNTADLDKVKAAYRDSKRLKITEADYKRDSSGNKVYYRGADTGKKGRRTPNVDVYWEELIRDFNDIGIVITHAQAVEKNEEDIIPAILAICDASWHAKDNFVSADTILSALTEDYVASSAYIEKFGDRYGYQDNDVLPFDKVSGKTKKPKQKKQQKPDEKPKAKKNAEEQTGPGLVMDDYVRANISRAEQKRLDESAKALGVTIRFADEVNGGKSNAQYENGVVTIEKNNPNPTLFLYGHEITHHLEDTAPDAHKRLKQYFKNQSDFRKRKNDLLEAYRSNGYQVSDDYIENEVVADMTGELIKSEDILRRFIKANRKNQTFLQKIFSAFRSLMAKLGGTGRSRDVAKACRLIEDAIDASVAKEFKKRGGVRDSLKTEYTALHIENQTYGRITQDGLARFMNFADRVAKGRVTPGNRVSRRTILKYYEENPEFDFVTRMSEGDENAANDLKSVLNTMENSIEIEFIADSMFKGPYHLRNDSLKDVMKIVNDRIEGLKMKQESANVPENVFGLNARDTFTLDDAETWFNAWNTDSVNADIARSVFDALKKNGTEFEIRFSEKMPRNVAGVISGRMLILDSGLFYKKDSTGNKKSEVLLHEMIHSVTVYALKSFDIGKKDDWMTEEIYDATRSIYEIYWYLEANYAKGRNIYGYTNAIEMVAELANPKFREELEKRSLLDRIIDAIATLIGIKRNAVSENALQASMEGLKKLITEFDVNQWKDYNYQFDKFRSEFFEEYGVTESVSTDGARYSLKTSQSKQWGITDEEVTRNPGNKQTSKTITEIVDWVQTQMGVQVTTGQMRGTPKTVRGYYRPSDQAVRTRINNNLPTITHELGHWLDDMTSRKTNGQFRDFSNSLSEEARSELLNNTDVVERYENDGVRVQVSEGFAEFIRELLKSKASAQTKFPTVYNEVYNSLDARQMQQLDYLADMVNDYMTAPADLGSVIRRQNDRVDTRTKKQQTEDKAHRLYQTWVDTNHAIELLTRETGDSSPYIAATNAAYAAHRAGAIITRNMYSLDGTELVGPSLKHALEGAGMNMKDEKSAKQEYDDFGTYLVAKHGPERIKKGAERSGKGRVTADDRMNDIAFLENTAAELEEKYPHFKDAAEALYQFQKDFLYEYAVGSGIISKKTADEWQDMWDHYVPFQRYMADGQGTASSASRGFANQVSGIYRFKGSGRDIIHPVDSVIGFVTRMTTVAVMNDVMRQLTDSVVRNGLEARWMEQVQTPEDVVKVSTEAFKKKVMKFINGQIDFESWEEDEIQEFEDGLMALDKEISKYMQGDPHGNVVSVYKNGKAEFWKVNDKLLLESLTSLQPKTLDGTLAMAATVTRFMTSNITGRNVVWSIMSNMPRDIVTAIVFSKDHNPAEVIGGMLRNYGNFLAGEKSNNQFFDEFIAMGGGQVTSWNADIDNSANIQRQMGWLTDYSTADTSVLQKGGRKVKGLGVGFIAALDHISAAIESGPRFAEYESLRKQGVSPQDAFYAAMDVTTNFARHGKMSQGVNYVVPFFNASVQGIDKFSRWIRATDVEGTKADRQKASVGRALVWAGASLLIAAMIYGFNNRDDENKKYYQMLSNYTKNNYFCISLGDGNFRTIPKPREIAVLESFFESAMEYAHGGNKDAFKDFYDYATEQLTPPAVSPVLQGIDVNALLSDFGMFGALSAINGNKDFLGNPIESRSFESSNTPINERMNSKTSVMAKWFADIVAASNLPSGIKENASPLKIDYFMKQVLGGFWKTPANIFPIGDEYKQENKAAFIAAGLGRAFVGNYTKDALYSNDLVNWMYDYKTEQARAANADTGDFDAEFNAKLAERYTDFYGGFYGLTKSASDSDEVRQLRKSVLDTMIQFKKQAENDMFPAYIEQLRQVAKDQSDKSVGDLMPQVFDKEIKDANGEKHMLTGAQYYEIQTLYNGYYAEGVQQILANDELSANEKASGIATMKDDIAARARREVLEMMGAPTSAVTTAESGKEKTTYIDKLEPFYDKVSTSEMAGLRVTVNAQKSYYMPDQKALDNSQSVKKAKAIVDYGLDLSEDDTAALMKALGVSDTVIEMYKAGVLEQTAAGMEEAYNNAWENYNNNNGGQ